MDQVMSQEATPLQREVRKFPLEGTNLHRILFDPQHQKAFHAQLKMYNPLVVSLYRIDLLPLFGASRTVMLLTTRGRKSGNYAARPSVIFE